MGTRICSPVHRTSQSVVENLDNSCVTKNLFGTSNPANANKFLPVNTPYTRSLNIYDSQKNVIRTSVKKCFTVSVEGNIGSGKSTCLKYFSKFSEVQAFEEPLDIWRNFNGFNMLGKLYENPDRWSFLFQSFVQLTRLNIHLTESNCPIKIIERSVQSNRHCFMEIAKKCKELKQVEYDILLEYYNFMHQNLAVDIDLIVYLKTSPEVVHQRVIKRGRTEEAGISIDYLRQIHNQYEEWLLGDKTLAPVLVIDADKNLESIVQEYTYCQPYILGKEMYSK